jgi:hypothetical protein
MEERDRHPSALEDEGIPDLLAGAEETGLSEIEDEYSITPSRTPASLDFGTTADEEIRGESLDGRIAREVPDVTPYPDDPETYGGGEPAGRIVEEDEGARTDVTKEAVAFDVGSDNGGFSAEEAAMHIEQDS